MRKEWDWFSKEDIDSWGPGNKKCRECLLILPFSEFHKHKDCMFGINTVCKKCRIPKSKKLYSEKRHEELLYDGAKSRAKKKSIVFDISVDDIVIPDVCPVLGIPLYKTGVKITDNTPTLDRIIPEKGYIKDNIIVISNRANRIKSNASSEEILMVYRWLVDITN